MEERWAAIYVRVSTEAQREEGYSIEAQREALTAYCVSKGIARSSIILTEASAAAT